MALKESEGASGLILFVPIEHLDKSKASTMAESPGDSVPRGTCCIPTAMPAFTCNTAIRRRSRTSGDLDAMLTHTPSELSSAFNAAVCNLGA